MRRFLYWFASFFARLQSADITSSISQLSLERTLLFELHWLIYSHKEVNYKLIQPIS